MDGITWKRNAEGGFDKTGELPAGCTEVQLKTGDGKPFGSYTPENGIAIVTDALAKGQLTKWDVYSVVPVAGAVKVIKADVPGLTETEVARVNEIQTEKNVDRVEAIKLMKKEQRAAGKPLKAAKPDGVAPAGKKAKYDAEQFKTIFLANPGKPLKEVVQLIVDATGASDCLIKFRLKGFGLLPSKGIESPTTNAGVVA